MEGKKKKLWNFSTLHCQLLLTSLGNLRHHSNPPQANEDVNHELNTFMWTF